MNPLYCKILGTPMPLMRWYRWNKHVFSRRMKAALVHGVRIADRQGEEYFATWRRQFVERKKLCGGRIVASARKNRSDVGNFNRLLLLLLLLHGGVAFEGVKMRWTDTSDVRQGCQISSAISRQQRVEVARNCVAQC